MFFLWSSTEPPPRLQRDPSCLEHGPDDACHSQPSSRCHHHFRIVLRLASLQRAFFTTLSAYHHAHARKACSSLLLPHYPSLPLVSSAHCPGLQRACPSPLSPTQCAPLSWAPFALQQPRELSPTCQLQNGPLRRLLRAGLSPRRRVRPSARHPSYQRRHQYASEPPLSSTRK